MCPASAEVHGGWRALGITPAVAHSVTMRVASRVFCLVRVTPG